MNSCSFDVPSSAFSSDNIRAKIEEMIKHFKVHRNANDFARKFIRDS